MSTQHTPGPWAMPDSEQGRISKVGVNGGWDGMIATADCGDYARSRSEGFANARLIAAAPDLLEACQTFAEWLRREDDGFDHKTHNRQTPEGEAAWREWFYGNIALCGLAQEQVRAAIAKATGGAV